jgi:hypothetical protein
MRKEKSVSPTPAALDCHPQKAHRILESFKALRLLSVAIQGTQHSKDAAGIATRWIWLTVPPRDGGGLEVATATLAKA